VEDDGIVAFLLGQTLENLGYEVCGIESNQADAISATKRLRPDLMIVDEHLGLESGLAVVEAVLRDGPMPHIFVSGDIARIRVLKPLAVILEKPYFETDLEQAIWRALARPRLDASPDPIPGTAEASAPTPRAERPC